MNVEQQTERFVFQFDDGQFLCEILDGKTFGVHVGWNIANACLFQTIEDFGRMANIMKSHAKKGRSGQLVRYADALAIHPEEFVVQFEGGEYIRIASDTSITTKCFTVDRAFRTTNPQLAGCVARNCIYPGGEVVSILSPPRQQLKFPWG
jgi:hypothetical protein